MTAKKQFIPKALWGPGPWQQEPDAQLFTYAGYTCFVFRNMLVTGSLCGYVALTPDHPWWGKAYDECAATPPCDPDAPVDWKNWPKDFPMPPVSSRMASRLAEPSWSCTHRPDAQLDVHGGVTYAGPMENIGNADERPQSFEWGFGFDCAHAGDLSPLLDTTLRLIYEAKGDLGLREWKAHQRLKNSGPLKERYRTFPYVMQQTEQLAEQLAEVKRGGTSSGSGTPRPGRDDAGTDDGRRDGSRYGGACAVGARLR